MAAVASHGANWSLAERSADRMRVMLLNYEYPPVGGGAGIATRSLAESLSEAGVIVDVVTGGSEDLPFSAGSAPMPGPSVFRVPTARRDLHSAGMAVGATFLLRALPVVRRLLRAGRYDAAHFFFTLPTGALLPLAQRAGVATVLSLRGSDVPGYDTTKPWLRRAHRVLRPITRSLWRHADRVVAVCTSLGDLARRTLPDLEFQVIGNGVDLERFRPGPGGPRPVAGDPLRCLAVSRLIERKDLDTLLHAFRALPAEGFRLTVVGSGTEEQRLRDLTRALSLDGVVRFVGAVPHEELVDYHRESDVFTLVPRAEAFGNSFAEAVASGLPVVGSAVGGVTDLVKPDVNGFLVPPGDPEATAAAIARLKDTRLRAEMGSRSRAIAEQTLSWKAISAAYLSIYRELGERLPIGTDRQAE